MWISFPTGRHSGVTAWCPGATRIVRTRAILWLARVQGWPWWYRPLAVGAALLSR
jgi:hypothetical protein